MKIQAGKTCIIYCRVSSTDQIEGTSLKTQEEVCRDFAARQGLDVLATFVEEGESAKTADRTKLIEAIDFCTRRKNRVDYFLYHKLDRSARMVEDYYSIRAVLRRCGTTLLSATEPIDDTPAGKLMETMLAGIAEFDNSVRTERTKAGMLARLRQGFWSWKPPVGYHRPSPGGNIAPDPYTAPHIRYAFEAFSSGFVTYRSLAERLTDRGLRTRTGKPFYYQSVEKILKNPLYCGIMEVWGEQYQGAFVPVVSDELWRRCQERFKVPTVHTRPRAANNPLFPLRKLVRCSTCYDPLTGSCPTNKQGRSYPYYHHWRRGCPASRSIPKTDLECEFVRWLRKNAPSSEALEVWRRVVLDTLREKCSDRRGESHQLDRELDLLKLERQRVFELHRSGFYGDTDFREQLRIVDTRIKQKSLLQAEKTSGEQNLANLLDQAMSELRHPAETWLELESDYQARLRFQERVFEGNLYWDGESFASTSNSAFRLVYRTNLEQLGSMSPLAAFVRENWNDLVRELQRWYGDPA